MGNINTQDKMSQISLQLTANLYDNLHPSNAAKILMKLIKTKTDIFKLASIKRWDCFISSTMEDLFKAGFQYLKEKESPELCTIQHLFEILTDGTLIKVNISVETGFVVGTINSSSHKLYHSRTVNEILCSIPEELLPKIEYCISKAQEYIDSYQITDETDFYSNYI